MWLRVGPLAIDVAGDVALPAPACLFAGRDAGDAAHRSSLAVVRDAHAGAAGPLVREAPNAWRGPGFTLRCTGDAFEARVADPIALLGAIAALVVAVGPRARVLLFHAAAVSWRGRAFLVLGPSGAGKSTLARAHAARAIASNAVVAWPSARGWRIAGAPFTGHGDAAVRPGSYVLGGALAISARARGPLDLASRVAILASGVATATHDAPPLDLVVACATSVPVRVRLYRRRSP